MGDYPQMIVPVDHVEPVPCRILRAVAHVGALTGWPESPTFASSTSSKSTGSQIRHKPKHLHTDGRSRTVWARTAERCGRRPRRPCARISGGVRLHDAPSD